MPRSANRHPVEILTARPEQLAERARHEWRPVTSVIVDRITVGLDAQDGYGRLSSKIAALHRTIETLRLALENR